MDLTRFHSDSVALAVAKSEAEKILYLLKERRRHGDAEYVPNRNLTRIEACANRIVEEIGKVNNPNQ